MRLLYLHQYFKLPSENGGTRSFDFGQRFSKNNIHVTVVTSTSDIKYKSRENWAFVKIEENFEVFYLYLPYNNSFSFFKRVIVFIQFIFFASIKVLQIKTDLVLATSTPLTIAIPAIVKKFFIGTPFVFEVRDVWPEAVIAIGAIKNQILISLLSNFEKLTYSLSSAIVVLSDDMEKSINIRFKDRFKNKISVIENISEISRFQMFDKMVFKLPFDTTNKFIILYAGTFGRVNGLDYVVELAQILKKKSKDVIFVLAGEGSEKQKFIELTESLNLLNCNIFVLNSVSKNDLPHLYSNVSMGSSFVANIPHLWYNSANKFFDSLAAAKPILINYEGWQKTVIEKYNIGYCLPPRIKESDVDLFLDYIKNSELIDIQSKNAVSLARKKYSLYLLESKYLKIFNKIYIEK